MVFKGSEKGGFACKVLKNIDFTGKSETLQAKLGFYGHESGF